MVAPEYRYDLDLGDGRWLAYVSWKPDRRLNPQYADLPNIEKLGALIAHTQPKNETGLCEGFITFDVPGAEQFAEAGHRWQAVVWEPLMLSPSVLCRCGDRGWVRGGRWVRA